MGVLRFADTWRHGSFGPVGTETKSRGADWTLLDRELLETGAVISVRASDLVRAALALLRGPVPRLTNGGMVCVLRRLIAQGCMLLPSLRVPSQGGSSRSPISPISISNHAALIVRRLRQ